MVRVRALNIKQPWAALIASGEKDLEVRSWRTDYRGPIVIVASKSPARLRDIGKHADLRHSAPRGVALCIVELVDIIPGQSSHRSRTGGFDPTGQWCWDFRRPRPVEVTPVRGKLGLWRWSSAEC